MIDHLSRWCEIRNQVPWQDVRHGRGWPVGPVRARRDGIVHHATTAEHDRDPVRAQRLLAAYAQVRTDVEVHRALDFGLLTSWQRTVTGATEVEFRSGPAFAKGGRERYGLHPDTAARFEACLTQSRDEQLPVASRAARVYLDVCFFHPFADGNARSAILALSSVLARSDIVLDQVGPLRQLRRPADDPEGALALADLVVILIEGTRRRLVTSSHANPAGMPG